MIYRNTKTGAEFESPCECAGPNLVKVEKKPAEKPQTQKKGVKK